MRTVAGWLVVLALIAAPVVGAWWVIARATSTVATSPVPVWVAAQEAPSSAVSPAVLVPVWARESPVVAPAWTGLVQQTLIAPGDKLGTGTKIVIIDGVTRIAAHTPFPFNRGLSRSDRGPDVAALNGLLAGLGKTTSPGDTYGSTTATAVGALAAELGAGKTDVFDPSWVVYLPFGKQETVAAVDLAVAQPAPALGAVVIEIAPTLTGARVVPSAAVPDNNGPGPADGGAAEPTSGPVEIDESLAYTDLTPGSDLALADKVVDGGLGADGTLSGAALGEVAPLLTPGAREVAVTLTQPRTSGTVQLPTAAVVTGPTGATCVLTRAPSGSSGSSGPAATSGTGGAASMVPVTVVDSFLGVSTVSGIDVGVEVRVSPPGSERASCR